MSGRKRSGWIIVLERSGSPFMVRATKRAAKKIIARWNVEHASLRCSDEPIRVTFDLPAKS